MQRTKPDDGFNELTLYTHIHNMANTMVIADEAWAEEPSTKEAIAKLTATVNASNWEDKQDLFNILNRWSAGDFCIS